MSTFSRRKSVYLPWSVALSFAAVLTLQPRTGDAAEYLTAAAGGGGGNAFALRCASDQVLAGVSGKASSLVDRVQPVCAQVDLAGHWIGNTVAGASAGGDGGTAFTLKCPRDQAVSGILGKAGTLLDQLRLRCGPLTAGARLASIGNVLAGQAGGTGGTAFGSLDCVDGKPGRGLSGRGSTYVDQLRLACDMPSEPVRSFGAGILDRNTGNYAPLARARGNPLMRVFVSSVPLGSYQIPVRNSNPSVARTIYPDAFEDSRGPGFNEVVVGNVGCASFDVGFPGDTPTRVELIVEKPGGPDLTLALSILEWKAATAGAFGTLTIANPAPAAGLTVAVTSSHASLAIVPATVTIPSGTRTTTFEIRRSGSAGACVVISAAASGTTAQSAMLFRPLSNSKNQ